MDLNGKVALITGGGTGLGREICFAFARAGCDVAVIYPSALPGAADEAEQTVVKLRELGRRALSADADVSVDAQVRAMVSQVEEHLGRLDVLVNNAGTTVFVPHADLEAMHEEDWDRIQAVNAKGPFLCARAAVPAMRRQGAGRIIGITSTSGLRPGGSSIAYAASKAAHQMIMRCLARALGPEITVNTVAPGIMPTGWGKRFGQEAWDRALAEAATKRLPDMADIAAAAVFLARNNSMSGQTIIVDGGRHMPL